MTQEQKPSMTDKEFASMDYAVMEGYGADMLDHIQSAFEAGADWQASLPSNDKQGQETPVDDGYKNALEEIIHTTASKVYTPFQKVDRCFGVAAAALDQTTSVNSEPNDKQGWIDVKAKLFDVLLKSLSELERVEGEVVSVKEIGGRVSVRMKNGNAYWLGLSKQSEVTLD